MGASLILSTPDCSACLGIAIATGGDFGVGLPPLVDSQIPPNSSMHITGIAYLAIAGLARVFGCPAGAPLREATIWLAVQRSAGFMAKQCRTTSAHGVWGAAVFIIAPSDQTSDAGEYPSRATSGAV